MRKTQTKNIAETCFDGKTLSCSLYFTLKTHVSAKVKAMKSMTIKEMTIFLVYIDSCSYCLQQHSTFRLPAQLTFVAIADAHPCAPSIDFLIVFEHSASVTHWCATSYTLIFCNLFATQAVFVSSRFHVYFERAPNVQCARILCIKFHVWSSPYGEKTRQTSFFGQMY